MFGITPGKLHQDVMGYRKKNKLEIGAVKRESGEGMQLSLVYPSPPPLSHLPNPYHNTFISPNIYRNSLYSASYNRANA